MDVRDTESGGNNNLEQVDRIFDVVKIKINQKLQFTIGTIKNIDTIHIVVTIIYKVCLYHPVGHVQEPSQRLLIDTRHRHEDRREQLQLE